jgi:hypothetical protein
MVYTIHLEATANGETVRAVVARAPQGELALIFPWGRRCALSDGHQLEALYDLCAARGVLLVIVGGDQQLRAHAVAAGFAAATSIEEWETSKHRAIRARREPVASRRHGRDDMGWTNPAMRVVAARRREADEREDLYTLDGEDPPAYIADLLARERLTQLEDHANVPTIPLQHGLQRGRPTRVLNETIRDWEEAEALERMHQLFEERLTETIRRTTGPLTLPEDESGQGGHQSGADS